MYVFSDKIEYGITEGMAYALLHKMDLLLEETVSYV
jgi:hypothetical protein